MEDLFFSLLQTLFSLVFKPVAYMLGIDWGECGTVATVLGIKLLPNEILAYLELGALRVEHKLSVSGRGSSSYMLRVSTRAQDFG